MMLLGGKTSIDPYVQIGDCKRLSSASSYKFSKAAAILLFKRPPVREGLTIRGLLMRLLSGAESKSDGSTESNGVNACLFVFCFGVISRGVLMWLQMRTEL